jgi:hypothetical protein
MKLNCISFIRFNNDGSSTTVSISAFAAIAANHTPELLEHLLKAIKPWMVREMAELDRVSGTSPSPKLEEEIRDGKFEKIFLAEFVK